MDDELTRRIQALPQELQDEILFFAVPIPFERTITIDSKHVAPWQLQLNQFSRRKLAPIYFGTNNFATYPNSVFSLSSRMEGSRWIRAQDPAHRDMIKSVVLLNCGRDSPRTYAIRIDLFRRRLSDEGATLRNAALGMVVDGSCECIASMQAMLRECLRTRPLATRPR